jgi:hypothetical protein
MRDNNQVTSYKDKNMSVYQKLQKVRVELQKKNLKKTGKNTYSNFTYYELGDFLPSVNALCLENGLFTHFRIIPDRNTERAILTVYDAKDGDKIDFIAPTAEAHIGAKRNKEGILVGGADPIQNLGGKITYLRRYLLMMAFEIVESDYVDPKEQGVELDSKSVDKINFAQTSKELAEFAKEIQKEKGKKYRPAILHEYNRRKMELENENL